MIDIHSLAVYLHNQRVGTLNYWAAEKHSLPLESRFVTTIDEHLKRLPLLLSTENGSVLNSLTSSL